MHTILRALAIVGISCSLSSLEIPKTQQIESCSPILKWEFPETMKSGEAIKIKLWYPLENSCGKFLKFSEKIEGNRVSVGIICSYPDGNPCMSVSKVEVTEYTFKPATKGTYLFTFLACDDIYKNYQIEVE